jgi:hypothetical protein
MALESVVPDRWKEISFLSSIEPLRFAWTRPDGLSVSRSRRLGSVSFALWFAACSTAGVGLAVDRSARADDRESGVAAAHDEVRVRGQSESAGFVSRAREGDTPRETTDAASLAETLPGVHVRRLGADDGFATLSIRGSGSSQVTVLFAGVPLTGGSDPTLDLGSLPVWPGVQIRAYRTFAPASLGPGSLGGTLALDPPKAIGSSTESYLAGGTLGVARMRVAASRPWGAGEVTSALSASRSDDEFDYFAPDARGGAYLRRRNAGHAQVSALVSALEPLSWTKDRKGSVRITLLGQMRHQELPGTAIDPTPFDRLETSRLMPVMELAGDAGPGAWRVRAYGRRDEEALLAGRGSTALPHGADAFIAAGGATGWRGAIAEGVKLDVQVDGSGERYAPGASTGVAREGARRLSTGGGADLDVVLSRGVSASASGRIDGWQDTSSSEGGGDRSDLRPTAHAGLEVRTGAWALAMHGGSTARPPAFVELFGDRGAFLPNPRLRTESAWTGDAGARVSPRAGALRLELALTGFATLASDLITFVPVGAFGRARADNIGRARIAGIEGELTARLAPFTIRAIYTGIRTENQGAGACTPVIGSCERPALPGRPANDLVVDGWVRLGVTRVRYGVDWVSGIQADLQGTVEVPARVLQSAGLRVDVPGVPGELTANAEVKNLFDVRVVEYQGVTGPVLLPVGDAWAYPLPGRTAMISLRWRE